MTILNNSIPRFCRFFVILLYLTVVPVISITFLGIFIPIFLFCETRDRSTYKGKLRPITQYMFCYKKRKNKNLGNILSILLWTLLISFSLVIGAIVLAIFIIPMYLFSFVSLIRMAYWWRKNKRLDELTSD